LEQARVEHSKRIYIGLVIHCMADLQKAPRISLLPRYANFDSAGRCKKTMRERLEKCFRIAELCLKDISTLDQLNQGLFG
jgi:hypothetical protein